MAKENKSYSNSGSLKWLNIQPLSNRIMRWLQLNHLLFHNEPQIIKEHISTRISLLSSTFLLLYRYWNGTLRNLYSLPVTWVSKPHYFDMQTLAVFRARNILVRWTLNYSFFSHVDSSFIQFRFRATYESKKVTKGILTLNWIDTKRKNGIWVLRETFSF